MLSHRDFLLHPTSMQSLVSSSVGGPGGGSGGGASNPGLRIAESSRHEDETEEDSVYCDLTRPVATSSTARNQSNSGTMSATRGAAQRPSATAPATKSISCLRTGLLAAFVFILLGVIVTSSYAIDRRLSQMPQLLYVGLGLCSVGLCLIVVSVSLLVVRQLGKQQQQRLRQRQRRQSAARHSASSHQHQQQRSRVPIWYIGCHRDTATAYCPPVPPSYWDSTTTAATPAAAVATASSTSPKLPRQVALPPPPLPPPQQQQQQQQRLLPLAPQPPPCPPSYQEALRCLEQRSSPRQPLEHHPVRPGSGARQAAVRQPIFSTSDQMSVLKWTVQSQYQHQLHHQRLQQQQQQQQQQQLLNYRSYQRQNSADSSMRRCESSSFIGEPILV